jgi:hypothetical protein
LAPSAETISQPFGSAGSERSTPAALRTIHPCSRVPRQVVLFTEGHTETGVFRRIDSLRANCMLAAKLDAKEDVRLLTAM